MAGAPTWQAGSPSWGPHQQGSERLLSAQASEENMLVGQTDQGSFQLHPP